VRHNDQAADNHKRSLEEALLKQKIEHLESELASMHERLNQKSLINEQIVTAIEQGTDTGLQKLQTENKSLRA
jgi:hypothetical protein